MSSPPARHSTRASQRWSAPAPPPWGWRWHGHSDAVARARGGRNGTLMAHLHIPDGVLPPALWGAGLALALLLLLLASRAMPRDGARNVAYQGALGGLMLAVMSIPIPIVAFEYCITLAGPVGVLLGPAAGYQVAFVVCVILALLGQGGITVVGLNALVMGATVAVARPAYDWFARGRSAPAALALATGVAQAAAGLCWFAL